jgi:plasmid stabilization system protein ParE
MASRPRKLKVVLTESAAIDLHGIWGWNAQTYGVAHADGYLDFLKKHAARLESTHRMGRIVNARPEYRYTLIRKRPRGHGHVIVYRVVNNTVQILRFFHTAQDWETNL